MAKNLYGQDIALAERETSVTLTPSQDAAIRNATANNDDLLKEIYAKVASVEANQVQIRNALMRATPVKETL